MYHCTPTPPHPAPRPVPAPHRTGFSPVSPTSHSSNANASRGDKMIKLELSRSHIWVRWKFVDQHNRKMCWVGIFGIFETRKFFVADCDKLEGIFCWKLSDKYTCGARELAEKESFRSKLAPKISQRRLAWRSRLANRKTRGFSTSLASGTSDCREAARRKPRRSFEARPIWPLNFLRLISISKN